LGTNQKLHFGTSINWPFFVPTNWRSCPSRIYFK
jgi:hypothetical protein